MISGDTITETSIKHAKEIMEIEWLYEWL
jgi:hypothetical protein